MSSIEGVANSISFFFFRHSISSFFCLFRCVAVFRFSLSGDKFSDLFRIGSRSFRNSLFFFFLLIKSFNPISPEDFLPSFSSSDSVVVIVVLKIFSECALVCSFFSGSVMDFFGDVLEDLREGLTLGMSETSSFVISACLQLKICFKVLKNEHSLLPDVNECQLIP